MRTKPLLDKIKKKFGTFSRFCKVAEIDRVWFANNVTRKDNVEPEVVSQIETLLATAVDQTGEQALTKEKIKSISGAINEAGGVKAFCVKNNTFSEATLFQILAGRYKYITPGVRRLLEHLNIE